jgi:hypothetical protein
MMEIHLPAFRHRSVVHGLPVAHFKFTVYAQQYTLFTPESFGDTWLCHCRSPPVQPRPQGMGNAVARIRENKYIRPGSAPEDTCDCWYLIVDPWVARCLCRSGCDSGTVRSTTPVQCLPRALFLSQRELPFGDPSPFLT